MRESSAPLPTSAGDIRRHRARTFPDWCLALGIALWLVLFHAWSLSELLYGSGPDPESRLSRWRLFTWSAGLSQEGIESPLVGLTRQLGDLPQVVERLPICAVAMGTWAMGILVGCGILQALMGSRRMGWSGLIIYGAALGMGFISLMVQGLGLAGWLTRTTVALAAGILIIVSVASIIVGRMTRNRTSDRALNADVDWKEKAPLILIVVCCALTAVFLSLGFLAASLPTPDYDAHAYHLLGPKEYFLNGRISFLSHNVYTSFPFLTEMFSLLGMVVLDDWFLGGLAGQTTIAGFGVLGTAGVGLLTSRFFGPSAGWCAALVFATAPWTLRLTAIPYVEGAMLAYGTLSLDAALRVPEGGWRWAAVTGALAGCAIGCKYTAVAFVAVPAVCLLAASAQRGARGSAFMAFAFGSALFAGPWLVRNWIWTGNPVFPLLYGVFDGEYWTSEKDTRFVRGHQSTDFELRTALSYARDIVSRSDWQSSLLFAFAPLAFFGRNRVGAMILLGLILFSFAVFFCGTHRLDRFFLTIQPMLAALAGAGVVVAWRRSSPILITAIVAAAILYNLAFCATPLAGMNHFMGRISEVRLIARASVAPSLAALQESGHVNGDECVLFVGLAAVYDFPSCARYNTVFDDNLFEQMAASPDGSLRDPSKVREELCAKGVDWVFVDWTWVERYRSPGNYGFTTFVRPEVFQSLVEAGVLEPTPPLGVNPAWRLYRVVCR